MINYKKQINKTSKKSKKFNKLIKKYKINLINNKKLNKN
jgi:hypothetical protein